MDKDYKRTQKSVLYLRGIAGMEVILYPHHTKNDLIGYDGTAHSSKGKQLIPRKTVVVHQK